MTIYLAEYPCYIKLTVIIIVQNLDPCWLHYAQHNVTGLATTKLVLKRCSISCDRVQLRSPYALYVRVAQDYYYYCNVSLSNKSELVDILDSVQGTNIEHGLKVVLKYYSNMLFYSCRHICDLRLCGETYSVQSSQRIVS